MSMCNNKFVIICFDSNSQTSKPIKNLKSPTVGLVGEDLEVEEQGGTEEEGKQELTKEDLDTSKKIERLPQMFGLILQGRKLKEKLKPNAIIVANFIWVILAKVQPIDRKSVV